MLLSVRLQTYNHQDFIEEALQGIENQITDFNFEVVIGDDFSTDDNVNIIKNFISTSKNSKIKYKLLNRNIGDDYWKKRQKQGRLYNFKNTIENCSGKYIALLDGDDYWTDPLKLQKQVDFLESNKQYSYCGCKSYSLKNNIITPIELAENEITFERLIKKNIVNTATLVFRKEVITTLPVFFKKLPAGDWLIQLIALKKSNGYVLNDFMSVYRIHEGGIWSKLSSKKMCEQGVKVLEGSKSIFNDKQSVKMINDAIRQRKKDFGVIEISVFEKLLKKIRLKFKL